MFLLNVNYKFALQTLHRASCRKVYKAPTFVNNSQNSQSKELNCIKKI